MGGTNEKQSNEKRSQDTVWRDNKTASECLSHLFCTKQLSDIDLTFENAKNITIRAHKVVLSMRSKVFEEELNKSDEQMFVIKDVNPEIMKVVLSFIYTDKAALSSKNVTACLHAAKKFHLVGLEQKCSDFLEKSIDAINVCFLYKSAIFYKMKSLEKKCFSFIKKNATNVLFTPSFLELSQASLLNVLKQDKLAADELDIFKAARKWAQKQCETNKISKTGENMRDQLKEDALFEIRFATIPFHDLVDAVEPTKILTTKELNMLYKYHGTKRQADLSEKFRKPERIRAPTITIDLRQYDIFEFDYCKNQKFYALEIGCEFFDMTYEEKSTADQVEYNRNSKSLKLKSISGTFVQRIGRISVSNTYVNDYQVVGNRITFQTPIKMCNGEIIQFIPENLEQPASVINLNGLNLKPFNINQNGDVFTLLQFPTTTETITFLK